ncbi:MAG: HD domain-containing protein [Candidatus Eisenbacteria bacterium]|nr:HD domain-containing protein [Candidatus Eisenbacteria bacterium]
MSASLRFQPPESVRVSEVLAALSFSLDLTEGQPMGHALRGCLIGMRLAERAGLSLGERRDLYYALILKDAGCSSNSARVFELFGGDERAAKHDLKRVDWSRYTRAARYAVAHAAPGARWIDRARRIASLARAGPRIATELVATRCESGADRLSRLGLGVRSADAVRALDEHWDGSGEPRGLRGAEIPMLARILCLSQTLEPFLMTDGPQAALLVARERSGRWFDPELVRACEGLESDLAAWAALDEVGVCEAVCAAEPGGDALLAGPGAVDRIARGFADVIDAKSPFTAQHSHRMAAYALKIAERLGLDAAHRRELERAALLHDLGKLSVPNSILDKPGPLTAEEWDVVRMHPWYTLRILNHIRGFGPLAEVAAAHHERLDGRGYFRGLRGEQVVLEARILAAADVFDALTATRPYRPALPEEVALRIMERDRGFGLCGDCLDALWDVVEPKSEPKDELSAARDREDFSSDQSEAAAA